MMAKIEPPTRLRLLKVWVFLVFVISMLTPKISVPEDHATGDIAIDTGNHRKDPYLVSQENTLAYFKNLRAEVNTVATTGKKILLPDANSINYLSGLYLFCSVKRGTCPAVLEALLEIDLINSRLSNASICPLMKSFWRAYLDNEFDDRLKYDMSTGFIAKVNEFNSKERPRFVRCDETLKGIFSDGRAPAALFAERYRSGSPALKSIDDVIALINKVSENNINVFVATGAQ